MNTPETTEFDDSARRRRLRFRAWHRGMKEVDLVLGRFADATVDAMEEADLLAFEALLNEPDPSILAWVTGEEAAPPDCNTPFLKRLIAFYR